MSTPYGEIGETVTFSDGTQATIVGDGSDNSPIFGWAPIPEWWPKDEQGNYRNPPFEIEQ